MATSNIQIVISAVDKATAGIKGVWKELEGFTERNKRNFQKMAGFWTAAFVGITAGIKKATDAYNVQAKAEALVTRWFERVADTWKMTSQDLFDEASKLQKTSIFWDEEILQKVTNNLLTFWGVWEEVFNRAQQTALDLATTLEGDLQSSTIMLWKALENPVQGLSALSRVWIKFSEDQEEMIKAMAGSWDVLGAQTLMLEEIEKLYGGASQAAADAIWPHHQLTKEMWDMVEVLGGAMRPALDSLMEWIRPIIESVSNWIKENQELTVKIILATGAIVAIIAVLWTLGLVLPSIVVWITAVIATVKALWVAMMFLAANPIWMVITAIAAWIAIWILIVKNWDTIIQKAKALWAVISKVFSWILTGFLKMIKSAYNWGKNLMSMLYNWLMSWFKKVRDWVLKIASTIKDFLWFGSPTKEWPNSDSDRWMPNLINMLAGWLEQWVSAVSRASERIAQALSDWVNSFTIEDISKKLESIQVEAMNMSSKIKEAITSQKSNVMGLVDEYRKLEEQIKAIEGNINSTIEWWRLEVAQRAIQIEDELLKIKEKESVLQSKIAQEQNESLNKELLELQSKKEKLQAEIQIAKMHTDDDKLQEARRLSERTQTDILLERIDAKVEEHLVEKERIEELKEAKKNQIRDEYEKYQALIEEKKALDTEYFNLFKERLNQQQAGIRESINLMKQLNAMSWASSWSTDWARALGWPVQWGRTYLVGERWPELFTPGSSGQVRTWTSGGWITINMWGVTVNNEADENRLIEKMKRVLTQEAKNFNLLWA